MTARTFQMIGLFGVTLILLASSVPSRAEEQETEDARRRVVFGLNPVFTGNDFTMDMNCQDPHNKRAACEPNCCLLVDKSCVERLFRVGRCNDLPGKPAIWRVRLVDGCTLTGPQKAPPDIAKRKPNTAYIVEISDGTEIEVSLGNGKNADLKKVPYGTAAAGKKLKLTHTDDERVCIYGFFTTSELPNGAFVCIGKEGKAIYGQTNAGEELLQQVKLTGGSTVSVDGRRGWLYKEARGQTPRLWFFSYPESKKSVQTYSDDNGVHWYPYWFLLRAVPIGEFNKGSSSTR